MVVSESIGKGFYTHARMPLESFVQGVCVLTVHNLHFEDSSGLILICLFASIG